MIHPAFILPSQKDSDIGPLASSGSDSNAVTPVEHKRRRHRHQRHSGIRNNGKNANNGKKNDKIGMDGKNWMNVKIFLESPSHFANLFASQSI